MEWNLDGCSYHDFRYKYQTNKYSWVWRLFPKVAFWKVYNYTYNILGSFPGVYVYSFREQLSSILQHREICKKKYYIGYLNIGFQNIASAENETQVAGKCI